MKYFLFFLIFTPTFISSQIPSWQCFIDSTSTVGSPKTCDLNNDGTLDIVIGGGTDGVFNDHGIIAIDGSNGSILWEKEAVDELFSRPIFIDITNDGVKDIFIAGRHSQLRAINGSTGNQIWEYFPSSLNPVDSGLYNFYSPQFISDVDNDGYPELLVSNGGDHAAPAWQTNRPPGHLMVISSLTGQLIAKAVSPDSAEIYCSPIIHNTQNNTNQWILFGTGGETLGGSFWATTLDELLNNDLSNSIQIATDSTTGYIAPASANVNENTGYIDFIVQSFGGSITKFNGNDFSVAWNKDFNNTESSAQPVIGNFTGTLTPDVFLVLFKGSNTSYTDFYQVLLDGEDGSIQFIDSIGALHFGSGNALDINNDGRDEAIVSLNDMNNGAFHHKLLAIDFENNNISQLVDNQSGLNLASTPIIKDLDNDGDLEIVYIVKKDSLNPSAWTGFYVNRLDLGISAPNSGVAWDGYLANDDDGLYNFSPIPCGTGSVIYTTTIMSPSCNGLNDGSITPETNSTGPYTYMWSNGSIDSSITNLSAGPYSVRVTNSQNCYEDRFYNLNDPFTISFGNIAPPTCSGDTNGMATLSSTGCPCMFSSCLFLWDNGITTKPNSSLTEGWHTVTITHTNGCVVIDSVLIPNSELIIDSAIISNVNCYGNQTGKVQIIANNSFSPINFFWQHGATGAIIDSLLPGTYTVLAEDSRPCIDSMQFNITEPDSITMILSVNDISCYGYNDGDVTINAAGGTAPFNYLINMTSFSSNTIDSLSIGTYLVYSIDSLGCISATESFTITQPDLLSVSLSSTLSSGFNVPDGSANALVSGGTIPYNYMWNDPLVQTSSTASNIIGGWYQVMVSDSNNCSVLDSVYVGAVSLGNIEDEDVFIYPNPTINKISIHGLSNFNYSVADFNGKIILKGNTEKTFSVKNLSKGTYLLELKKENKVLQFSLIKK